MTNSYTSLQLFRITTALEILYGLHQNQIYLVNTRKIANLLHNREETSWNTSVSSESYRGKIIYRILNEMKDKKWVQKSQKNQWQLTLKGLKLGKFFSTQEDQELELRKELPILNTLEENEFYDFSRPFEDYFNLHIMFKDKGDFGDAYTELTYLDKKTYKYYIGFGLMLFYASISGKVVDFADRSYLHILDSLSDESIEDVITQQFQQPEVFEQIQVKINESLLNWSSSLKEIRNEICGSCKGILQKKINEIEKMKLRNLEFNDLPKNR